MINPKFATAHSKAPRHWLALPALLALTGCQTPPSAEQAMKIVPTTQVTHSIDSGEAAYAIGRYYQGQRRDELAIAAYRQSIALAPRHAEAYNALGLVLAHRDEFEAALAAFTQAAALAPTSARIRNNLGYAQLRHGDFAAAIRTLEAARQLDPSNPRIADNLQLAMAGAAQGLGAMASTGEAPARAADASSAGPMAEQHPAHRRLAVLATGSETPALIAAVAPRTSDLDRARTNSALIEAAPCRLEIANGNGVAGLARRLSATLGNSGYTAARITNRKPFTLAESEIQYRPGQEAAARALSTQLPSSRLVASTRLRHDIQVRLVLGKDFREIPAAARRG